MFGWTGNLNELGVSKQNARGKENTRVDVVERQDPLSREFPAELFEQKKKSQISSSLNSLKVRKDAEGS